MCLKTFDADFDGENVRKPQLTKTMKAAQGEAKKKAEAFIAKLVKDLNKKRHPNIGPVTPEHFYILEKRLKTSIGIKPKTRGEQEIDKANSLKSKRLTEKSAEAEK